VARIRVVARDWNKVASVVSVRSITRVGGTFVVVVTGDWFDGTSTSDTGRWVARVSRGTSDRGKDTASTNTSIGSTGVAVVTSDVVEDTLSSGRGTRSWVASVRTGGAIYSGMLADSRSGGRVTSIDGTGVSIVTVVGGVDTFSRSERGVTRGREASIYSGTSDTSARGTSDRCVDTSSSIIARVYSTYIVIIAIQISSLKSSSLGTCFISASISVIKVN